MKMIYITSLRQQARNLHLKPFNSYSVPALIYFHPSPLQEANSHVEIISALAKQKNVQDFKPFIDTTTYS